MTEQQLHGTSADFLNWALPPCVFWTTFPAGGGGYDRGKILRRLGLRAGVPDIILIYQGRLYGIELKTATGRLSAVQVECHAAIIAAGGLVVVVRSLDQLLAALDIWQIPHRLVKPESKLISSFREALMRESRIRDGVFDPFSLERGTIND